MLITIDGGTSNTRLCLQKDGEILSAVRLDKGARFGTQNKPQFLAELGEALHTLLSRDHLSENDIEAVLASGMITSEGGLCEIPHIPSPAGREELHRAMRRLSFPMLCACPFYLIPGVRSFGADYRTTDVMRGEETELIGIQDAMDFHGCGTVILPGSHSKRIETDDDGKIVSFCTALTGEMLAAVCSATILSSSVTLGKNERLNDFLYEGYDFCHENGINSALFKVRILDRFAGHPADDVYSYLMGVILHDEIEQLAKEHTPVLIGGRSSFKEASKLLLERYSDRAVTSVPDEIAAKAANLGMEAVFRCAD